MALGQYNAISLGKARNARRAARRDLKAGIDPQARKKAAERAAANQKSFKQAADEWLELINKKPRAERPGIVTNGWCANHVRFHFGRQKHSACADERQGSANCA
jgi:Arm DNA-binding domain